MLVFVESWCDEWHAAVPGVDGAEDSVDTSADLVLSDPVSVGSDAPLGVETDTEGVDTAVVSQLCGGASSDVKSFSGAHLGAPTTRLTIGESPTAAHFLMLMSLGTSLDATKCNSTKQDGSHLKPMQETQVYT